MYRGIYNLKPYKDRKLHALALWLIGYGITAGIVTSSGLVLGLSAAIFLLVNQYIWGLVFILASVFADMLDGTMARLSRAETLNGKLFDAVSDRLVEIAWVGTAVFTGLIPWWGWLLPLGSILLLAARCWAFRYGLKTSFILITRFERILVMLLIVVIPWHPIVYPLYLLVTLGTFIAAIRIIAFTLSQCNNNNSKSEKTAG